jgi:hypothetical protein
MTLGVTLAVPDTVEAGTVVVPAITATAAFAKAVTVTAGTLAVQSIVEGLTVTVDCR